jgi:hypothetical protein
MFILIYWPKIIIKPVSWINAGIRLRIDSAEFVKYSANMMVGISIKSHNLPFNEIYFTLSKNGDDSSK